MLIGSLRPVETRTVEAEGESLAAVQKAVSAQAPAGWVVTDIPVKMPAGAAKLTTTATLARRDELAEIEADDIPALEAKVPTGWQMVSVRTV